VLGGWVEWGGKVGVAREAWEGGVGKKTALDKRDLAAPGILIFTSPHLHNPPTILYPYPTNPFSFICLFSYCNSSGP
jgi:hypothetical protein